MQPKIVEHLTKPIRTRIFFEIYSEGEMTTKQLLEKFADVPQPTLYRHVKALLDAEIIKVVGEKRIRGAVEKTYSVNVDFGSDIERIVLENDGAGYFQLFSQFMLGVMGEFKVYSEVKDIDIVQDASAFTTAPIYATTEEIHEALEKIGAVIMPLVQNEPTPERKLRSLCLILTPPRR